MLLIEDSFPKQLCNLHGFGDQRRLRAKTTLQHGRNWQAALTFPAEKKDLPAKRTIFPPR
jgi:hypothetical protein